MKSPERTPPCHRHPPGTSEKSPSISTLCFFGSIFRTWFAVYGTP